MNSPSKFCNTVLLLSTVSVGSCSSYTLSNSSHQFAVDLPLTLFLLQSTDLFIPHFKYFGLFPLSPQNCLLLLWHIVCPLLALCLPLDLLLFWPLATLCKWQYLSAKLTQWMLTICLAQRPYTSKLALLSLLQTACCAPLFWPTFLCSPVGIIVIVDSLHVLDPLLTFLFYTVLKLSCCMASNDELMSRYWHIPKLCSSTGHTQTFLRKVLVTIASCCWVGPIFTWLHCVSIITLEQDLLLIHENFVLSAIVVWHCVY